MSARWRVHGSPEGMSEQRRQVLPGLVPGSEQLEPVRRPSVDTDRRLALRLWRNVLLWDLQTWKLVGFLQGEP